MTAPDAELLPLDLTDTEARPQATEAQMVRLLVKRYTKVSMGAHRYVFADHVPAQMPWATRIADFIAIDCWQAQRPRIPLRHEIHGHEIKVSRSDWLAELRDPGKAEAFRPYCHRWWLVVSDASIVRPGELPSGWGLMVQRGDTVACRTPAPLLWPAPMPAVMHASFARAAARTAARLVTS